MELLKKCIILLLAIVIILGVLLRCEILKNKSLEKKWEVSEENVKYYTEQYSNLDNKNRALHLTIEQLNYSNDSIVQKLNDVRNELKVKDKDLSSIQYITTTYTKTDTIILNDTIFKNPYIKVDTTLSDNWYSLKLGLEYPSKISVTPSFKSDKYIVVSSKKETVEPPKKFFLLRWFQKKHIVLQIDVVEKNPYIKSDNSRYIDIIH